jgi:glycosyltransferase involved in cell wall biosynthesis
MRPSSRTVVLTSRENFVWHSMQEIIPMIERSWTMAAKPNEREVRVVDVDRETMSEYLPALMAADTIVFTCFTVKLARLGEVFRKKFSLQARYVIYLHNQVTIGAWPFFHWGLGHVLKKGDLFVSSSSFDARALDLVFHQPRVLKIPFALSGDSESGPGVEPTNEAGGLARESVRFLYAGRISAQKNLHALLCGYRLWRDMNPDRGACLDLYGGEDDLGSPNMAMSGRGYLEFLERLKSSLRLGDEVRFHGHFPREKLHREIAKPHVFVSPSLHSDENFGMSALRSLASGAPCVLSRWGGHADFAEEFPSQVFLVPVGGGDFGPFLDPQKLAWAMNQASRRDPLMEKPRLPGRYMLESVAERVAEVFELPVEESPEPLEPTELAKRLLVKREKHEIETGSHSRIFSSYFDPDAAKFFTAYGMGAVEIPSLGQVRAGGLRILPWVSLKSQSEALAEDPHRGHADIRARELSAIDIGVKDFSGQELGAIDLALARLLIEAGYAVFT